MPNYKHGVYGELGLSGSEGALQAQSAMVYVGTAPVGQIAGGKDTLNVPVVCRTLSEAKKALGYSDSWADYTLCEAM